MLPDKKNIRVLAIPFYIFFLLNGYGQENNEIISTDSFINSESFEKTYLHTDKDFYYHNETIWLNLYLLNSGSHLSITKSQVAYVELLDANNDLVIQKRLYVENLSKSNYIDISSSFKPGTYTLRAYTLYMQNEGSPVPFEKQIFIGPKFKESSNYIEGKGQLNYKNPSSFESNLQIQFFPEGGQIVNGIETSIGIKITDEKGKGVTSEGKIFDEENQIISFFKSQEFGLGVFKILPLPNKRYFAVLSNGLKFELPERASEGYVLNAKNKANAILIEINTNIPRGLEGLRLTGFLRGQSIYNQKIIADKNQDSYKVRLLTEGLPTGVAEFTLRTANGDPVCKRLVFIHQIANEVVASIETNSEQYALRQKVSAKINLNDKKEKPLFGTVSLSVTMIDRVDLSNSAHSIKNWLLLNSDIGAAINNPGYFFANDSINKHYLLDALMICSGWSRFEEEKIAAPKTELKSLLNPEKGIMIAGKTVDFTAESKSKQANVKINLLGINKNVYNEEQVTDSLGNFNFGPYVFSDTLKAIINAESVEKRRNGKSKKLAILMQEEAQSLNKKAAKTKKNNSFLLQDEKLTSPASFSTRPKSLDFQIDSNVIELDEAIVSEKKLTRKDSINLAFKKLSPLYTSPTHRIFPDSIPGTRIRVFDFLKLFGARFKGAFPNETILLGLRFGGSPVFVVDGVVVDAQFVDAMNTDNIEFIDVLYPGNAGGYVNIAGNGVVVIYSKGSLNLSQKRKPIALPNIKGLEVSGFSSDKTIQIIDYSESKPEHSKPDNRSTLYWQPDFKIDNSDFSFYTGDLPGSYIIKMEGVTMDGRPISAVKVFTVKAK